MLGDLLFTRNNRRSGLDLLRILIIAWPCIHKGGAERWWYYVLNELRNTNCSYFITVPLSLNLGCYKCPAMLRSSNVSLVYMNSRRSVLLDLILWIKVLINVIRNNSIDIIVAGYQTPRIVLAAILAGIISKRRCFVVFHMPIGWLPYYRGVELSRVHKPLVKIYELLNRYLSFFIFCSPSVVYDLKRVHLKATRFCSAKGSGVIVPSMINYRAYESRNIDIIHLASISKIKGANDVLLVIKKIKEKVPNIRAVIVGGISDSLKEEIQSMLKDYGIEDNVKILGYVDGFKKFDLLAKSKVMVYPSYMDTFAISVLEALSMGTPVVAYGIPAIKINYRTNAVAKAQTGNIDDLVEKTLKLLSDKQSWEKLSKEAMNFAVTYSWSAIAKSFLACVSEGLRE